MYYLGDMYAQAITLTSDQGIILLDPALHNVTLATVHEEIKLGGIYKRGDQKFKVISFVYNGNQTDCMVEWIENGLIDFIDEEVIKRYCKEVKETEDFSAEYEPTCICESRTLFNLGCQCGYITKPFRSNVYA